MYKALSIYLLFSISSCVCISKSVPRRLYQPVAALGFSFSCWEARSGGDFFEHACVWPGAQQARWGSWWALLPTLCLCSRPSGQNVRTAQEAVQPVRHLQGGQDCRCGVVKGMVVVYVAYPAPSLGCCRLGFRRSLRPSACRRVAVVSVKWFAVISELSIVACKHTSREPFWPSSPPGLFSPLNAPVVFCKPHKSQVVFLCLSVKDFHSQCSFLEWNVAPHPFPQRYILLKKAWWILPCLCFLFIFERCRSYCLGVNFVRRLVRARAGSSSWLLVPAFLC